LHIRTPPFFQAEVEKEGWEYRWACFGVRGQEQWTIQP